MGRACDFCEKKTMFGHQITRRGKAKYLGGVGRKITGISSRKFKPNIQRMKAIVAGTACTVKVCAKCLRSGKVVRPVVWVKPAEPVAPTTK